MFRREPTHALGITTRVPGAEGPLIRKTLSSVVHDTVFLNDHFHFILISDFPTLYPHPALLSFRLIPRKLVFAAHIPFCVGISVASSKTLRAPLKQRRPSPHENNNVTFVERTSAGREHDVRRCPLSFPRQKKKKRNTNYKKSGRRWPSRPECGFDSAG